MTQQPYQQPGSQRPGQMTAVMRAVALSGPKVLRIGLVQGGRIIEERIIKQRTHVTVGPSEKSMFVVATQNVPPNFRIFELVGNEYHLNFLDGMTGRIALPTGISDLSVLKGQARRTQQGAYQIRLTEDSRGKVVIGNTTLLFQFVTPPPVQPKPQLPVAVTSGATSIDWPTTMIAAFSFLLHFLAIGAAYSDWLDPVVDDEVNVAGLVDSVKNLPPPPPVEETEAGWTERLLARFGFASDEEPGAPARPLAADDNLPSLVSVISSSINIMQVRIARSRLAGEPADLLVSPRVSQLGLMDYHRADEAIAEGVAAVARVRSLLRELLGGTNE